MIASSQLIQMSRGGSVHEATVTWWYEPMVHAVAITSVAFDRVEARADDAFEALCLVREELEPDGWRVGVVGAQVDVWPSGMARDQGGGQKAYRLIDGRVEGLVDVFEPVDPASVSTVAEQQAHAERFHGGMPVRATNR